MWQTNWTREIIVWPQYGQRKYWQMFAHGFKTLQQHTHTQQIDTNWFCSSSLGDKCTSQFSCLASVQLQYRSWRMSLAVFMTADDCKNKLLHSLPQIGIVFATFPWSHGAQFHVILKIIFVLPRFGFPLTMAFPTNFLEIVVRKSSTFYLKPGWKTRWERLLMMLHMSVWERLLPRILTNCQPILRIAQNPLTKSTSYQPHIAAVYGSNTCLLARFALRGFQHRVNHNFVHLSDLSNIPLSHTVFSNSYISFGKKHTHDQFWILWHKRSPKDSPSFRTICRNSMPCNASSSKIHGLKRSHIWK